MTPLLGAAGLAVDAGYGYLLKSRLTRALDAAGTGELVLNAEVRTPTRFMRVFGADTMTMAASTPVVTQSTGLELALVLDSTGSLRGAPLAELKQATHALVDRLHGSGAVR